MHSRANSDLAGLRVLLLDNGSSFTQNLAHYLAQITGALPTVVANDSAGAIDLDAFDACVLSPGPGRPEQPGDFGRCAEMVAQCRVPVLGICLGHQGLGVSFGASLEACDELFHGRSSAIFHEDDPLFAGIPRGFRATRYHSLGLCDPLPPVLKCIARTETGEIMALRHRHQPKWGVQFHPESWATEEGHRLLANFLRLAKGASAAAAAVVVAAAEKGERDAEGQGERREGEGRAHCADTSRRRPAPLAWDVHVRHVENAPDPADFFEDLYGDSPTAFWLDGASNQSMSYLGDASGPHGYRLAYDVESRCITFSEGREGQHRCEGGVFKYLDELLASNEVASEAASPGTTLELDFCGGLVGYFGYELKAEGGAGHAHRSPWPDAQWLWVDRFIAYDCLARRATLVALVPSGESPEASQDWLEASTERIREPSAVARVAWPSPALVWRDSRERYLRNVAACLGKITEGESYELCLTTQMYARAQVNSLELFRRFRERNPAPYAAYLRCKDMDLVSSSPECFLRVNKSRSVIARPIKGTAQRYLNVERDSASANELLASVKERAENLMIVDLVRHDLSHSCEVGSVEVSAFASLESYFSVHQLVSTVRGQLRDGVSAMQCVAQSFPGGSMTGAPKKRSMEILDSLETGPRGPYSGSLGYLSMTGPVHLSIVIRSAVVDQEGVHLGVGGAITALSCPVSEYQEVQIKARAQVEALRAKPLGLECK